MISNFADKIVFGTLKNIKLAYFNPLTNYTAYFEKISALILKEEKTSPQ